MADMSRVDVSDLDGRLLQLLLAVHDAGSITGAAQRLGVTQSAVSHLLDKLRAIVGDPLFVKAGRGIAPTARALALAPRARALLLEMQAFTHGETFNPATLQATLTIAANDLQRDLLLPLLFNRLQAQAPGLRLRVVASGAPTPQALREDRVQLLITPRPPDATDIVQRHLFDDVYRVFFDAAQRPAPTLPAYLAAEHVSVVHDDQRALEIDRTLAGQGVARRLVVQVPSFAAVAPFIAGSTRLATLPRVLGMGALRGLAQAEPPVPCPRLPMFMAWHLQHQHSPLQQWLRAELLALVPLALPGEALWA